jgi:hypothetical protein
MNDLGPRGFHARTLAGSKDNGSGGAWTHLNQDNCVNGRPEHATHRRSDKGSLGEKAWPYNSLRMLGRARTACGFA